MPPFSVTKQSAVIYARMNGSSSFIDLANIEQGTTAILISIAYGRNFVRLATVAADGIAA
jgi:hypothetical protein